MSPSPILTGIFTPRGTGRHMDADDLVAGARGLVLNVIQNRPGICFSDVAHLTLLGLGHCAHSLYVLERAGLIRSTKAGRFRRYFPQGEAPSRLDATRAVLRGARCAAVAAAVRDVGHLGVNAIHRIVRSGFRQTTSYHLDRLELAGAIVSERVAQFRRVRLTPEGEAALLEVA